jgi:hypothetical protein
MKTLYSCLFFPTHEYMNVEGRWSDNCQGKDECVGENMISLSLYRTNPLWTTLKLKMGVRRKTPAANRLKDVVVQLTHNNNFVLFFLYCPGILYVLYVSHKLNFIMLSSRFSVTHTLCLHFNFLVSRLGMGGI